MTDASDEEIVTFRLPRSARSAIQRLVDAGEFQNRSDFLRHAVRSTLREHAPARARQAMPDLDLEGVELGAPDAPHRRGARSASRARRGSL